MEFIMGLLVGMFPAATLYMVVGLFVTAVILEYVDWQIPKVLVCFALTIYATCYFKLGVDATLVVAGVYLVIGLIWSFYRYKRYVKTEIQQIVGSDEFIAYQKNEKAYGWNRTRQQEAIDNLHPSKKLNLITDWIVFWPLSLINNFCSDFIDVIQTVVKKFFKSVYVKIFNDATKDIHFNIVNEDDETSRKADHQQEWHDIKKENTGTTTID
jgi:hypothetical protein